MTLRRLLPALCVLVACQSFAPDSWAAPRRSAGGFRQGFELNPYFTFIDFDSKAELEDEIGAGFRFGYLYNPNHEIEFMINSATADDEFFPGESVDVTNFQAAYVFNFTSHGVVPYFTAGLGFVHFDDSSPFLGSETDAVLGLGGGVRFFLGRVVYARFEYRANFHEGDGDVFASGEDFTFRELAFGVGWRFPTR